MPLASSCRAAANRPSWSEREKAVSVSGLAGEAPCRSATAMAAAVHRDARFTALSFPAPISILSAMDSIGSGAGTGSSPGPRRR